MTEIISIVNIVNLPLSSKEIEGQILRLIFRANQYYFSLIMSVTFHSNS